MSEPTARFRLARSIDLKKADPACPNCRGRGVVELRRLDVPGSGPTDVPVICRCVSNGGGVAPDLFDKVVAETQRRLDDGTFGDALVEDIRALPAENRARAVAGLAKQAERPELDEVVRREVLRALDKLRGDAALEVQA